jgi:nucleotide-binding universal stress UspA family protein
VFDRIVCAVDASPLSLEAVRQARVLGAGVGQIELVGVIETLADHYSAYGAAAAVTENEHWLARRLEEARAICPSARTELLQGPKAARLLELIEEIHGTLVAVAASGRHRGIGIVRGELATEMLHRAPSSVLVVRVPDSGTVVRRSIVVGYDGSAGAASALSVARDLADRLDTSLRVVAAHDAAAKEFDLPGLTVERDERPAVDALLDAAADADLLIVGSRGLHGLRALGSVSERVGHRAACSVLIVRDGAREDDLPGATAP